MDLTTRYLGLDLAHPIVPSASPLTEHLDSIRRLEDAGAPAIVLHSLFEEQISGESRQLDHYLSFATDANPEALSYFPDNGEYRVGPDQYLEKIRAAREAIGVPVIASLNGVSTGGWVEHARLMEEAGAHALELNIYYLPTSPWLSGAAVETMYENVVRDVAAVLNIPLAVKIGPYFSALPYMARRLAEAGADGLVLFNRFYQPDLDLEALEVVPNLLLSSSEELRLPLRWIAILHGRVAADLALTTGIHEPLDVLKGLMAGASVTMVASELLKNGIDRLRELQVGVTEWMHEHGYESVKGLQGSMSQQHVAEPAAFERANYMKVLQSWGTKPRGIPPAPATGIEL
jgi:dihydroorotate dehydrogenase (fumarate)